MAFKLAIKSLLPLATRTVAAFPKTFQRTITPLIGVQKQSVCFPNFLPVPAASRFFSETAKDNSPSYIALRGIIDSEVYDFPVQPVFEVAGVSHDRVTFAKKCNGESVTVEAFDRPSKVKENPDENIENSKPSGLKLVVVNVKQDGTQLQFTIRAFRDEIRIDHINLLVPSQEEGAVHPFKFSDLDEDLQAAFYKYLAVRGITHKGKVRPPKWYKGIWYQLVSIFG